MLSYAPYEKILIHYYNDEGEWSSKQLKKLLAIHKLLNVAKYLNEDWKPDWESNEEEKYYIEIWQNKVMVSVRTMSNSSIVHFRTQELAQQAIQILGEETIRLALSNSY